MAEETLAPQLRFPAVSFRTAEFPLTLPPFVGFPCGWSGTLDEFLTALRRQEINLEQAPLAAVVDQYLAHQERLGLDEAGEFLHVAAALIDWKARLLLPCDPILAEPDPRQEIVRTLTAGARASPSPEFTDDRRLNARTEPPAGLSLLDLMLLLHEVEQRALVSPWHAVPTPEVTVADQLRWLFEQLSQRPRDERPNTDRWFALHPSLPAKICLFLALLELSKQGRVRLEQSHAFAPITVLPA